VAALFSALGIWLGLRLVRPKQIVVEREVVREVHAGAGEVAFEVDRRRLDALGITPREHEILTLIARGLSNREIAERLYVSENTVKTHASRLFQKLDARRRTQAVQIAKESGLIA
jgi:DNA-binding NarL/FixJ family response regulator